MNVNNDELKWFIGNTLPGPDKLNIEWEDGEDCYYKSNILFEIK